VDVNHADARPGELLHSCLDASKLRALGWAPEVTLHEGLGITYRHINQREAAA
jgi:nucleoside-diphosphate-sugar epimerase